jgi:hypothetical protein
MKQIAQGLAALGRGEDKMLVHMTPKEVAGLQQLALAHGGSLTVHPQTGLPEAGFLSNILPALAGAAAVYFTGGLGAFGLGASGTGALAGAATGALQNRNNPLQGAIMGGLGGYGGAGLTSAGLEALGTQTAGTAVSSQTPVAGNAFLQSGTPAATDTAATRLFGTPQLANAASVPDVTGPMSMVPNAPPPTFAEALAKQFPTTGSKVAAGIGGLGALGAFEQKPLSFATPPTQTSNARLSGPVRRPYDQNAPQGYYFTDRGILQPAYAAGGGVGGDGIAALAKGGQYLDGPGDGMSDSIPATIGDKQPARLADGEFVVPADVVSHLGNGSSKAGAKQLYAMMDKVRHARTGTKKQGKQIKAEKYLPA